MDVETNTLLDVEDNDATLVAIGCDYVLSKQVHLLFAYAATYNDDLANYRVTCGGHGDQVTPVISEVTSGLSAGIHCDF